MFIYLPTKIRKNSCYASFYHGFILDDSGKCHVFMFTLFSMSQNPGGKFDPPLHNQQVNFSHVFAINMLFIPKF